MKIKLNREFLFLAAILLVGLLTVPGYGAYLDQVEQQRILYGNMKEYLMHLPEEAPPQLVQEMDNLGIPEISIDEDRDHGMACFYPIFWIWYVNKISPYANNIIWQLYNFLLIFWGICSLYFLIKELFCSKYFAAFMSLLFFLSPRMFAESHYNNKDMVLCALTFVMFYWGLRLMRETSLKSIILFSFAGALAFNIKLIGAYIFGILGLYILLYFIANHKFNRKIFGKAVLCLGLWLAFFLLLTPASWTNIKDFFMYLYEEAVNYDLWHDYILFNGKLIHKDYTGIPHKYLFTMIILTTPVLILLMTAAGFLLCIGELIKNGPKHLWTETGYIFCMIMTGAIPGLYATLAATPLYNGWRHLYFIYASMIIASGFCCHKIKILLKKWNKSNLGKIFGTFYLAILAVGILLNYPNEHSYYNFLAGDNVVERFELDYWDMSIKEALDSIWENESDKQKITVSAFNNPTMWGLVDQLHYFPTYKQQVFTVDDTWENSAYLVINTTYAVMYSKDEYDYVKNNYELIEQFSSYGNIICEVWKKP